VHRDDGQWVSESTGEGYFPEASALAVDPIGRPYAICIWSYHYYGYVTLTMRLGSAWQRLDQSENSAWFNPGSAGVDLALDGNGEAHAIVNPIGDTFYYHGPGFGTTFPDMNYFAIAVNSQNEPVIVYNTGSEIQIMTRESCLWAQFTVGTLDECGRVDIAIDGDDIPHLVYCDRSSGSQKVFYARRGAYGGVWQIDEIDTGSNASITVDGDRHPHVAYTTQADPTGLDLKYATTTPLVPVESRSWGSLKALFRKRGQGE
jgi:hypothetical protein